ncbi:MAG: hypothetical protein LBT50_09480 [Prevotellaceae bacterium]|jgi:hypothetical protein|nr:hypothetical protein [Prevotellaceae bacterium]
MRKVLIGILALSLCIVSCKKDENEEAPAPDIKKEDALATWKISAAPTIDITINGSPEAKAQLTEKLNYLFRNNDLYQFRTDDTCVITRGSVIKFPYRVSGNKIILDGYIEFISRFGADNATLTLSAGLDECKKIMQTQMGLAKKEDGSAEYSKEDIDAALRYFAAAKVFISFTKQP